MIWEWKWCARVGVYDLVSKQKKKLGEGVVTGGCCGNKPFRIQTVLFFLRVD